MNLRQLLPIDEVIPRIVSQVGVAGNLVVEAPPGAGKTTRVPPALLGAISGEVLVLEPRRLAARMAARRVASEFGEQPGETVGYQVRFESVGGKHTRLRFLTEGVLVRRLVSDPHLPGVGAVVLDEFHERHLDGDLALALLRRLQATSRPDLHVVVMSATLDGGPVAEFLVACSVVRSEGRLHPLDIRYTPHSADSLEEQTAAALTGLVREGLDGDVLVFLPGAAEIRRCARICAPVASRAGAEVAPLHGDLSPTEQDRAVEPGARPKVILSTNVAESSITIEGVTAVIDSGLVRAASDSPWTGLPTLQVTRVSQASATQRAGRAGRVKPGRVVRLYPEADFVRRVSHDPPEITRRELAQTCLDLRALGVAHPKELEWLTPPPEAAVDASESLLGWLGAVDDGGALTDDGRRMARLPLHPRLARLVIEAERLGVGEDGCAAAAVLSVGQRLPDGSADSLGPSDVLAILDAGLSQQARRLAAQIRRLVRPSRQSATDDAPLLTALLMAFPDRVARRRSGYDLLLAAGGSARLSAASVVRRHDLLLAVDIEERKEKGVPLVRLASAVRPEWLFDLFPNRVTDRTTVEWNRRSERVEAVSALYFDQIVIEESRGGDPDPAQASALLAGKAVEAGIGRFTDLVALEAFVNRVAFASEHTTVPRLTETDIREALEVLCYGLRSFRDLGSAAGNGGLLRVLRERLSREQRRLLSEYAPERVQLRRGRRSRIHYAAGKPPWTASRLQDFFGMTETPRIARGAVPLVLHLLAPSQRPVQTTTDLAGFWKRLYPEVRRELRRRYPKHPWPEDPLS